MPRKRCREDAGEGEEHDGEVDRVAVISSGRHRDDGGDGVRGPAAANDDDDDDDDE